MTRRALIVVDVQNDFISGSLSLSNCPSKHDGGQVVPLINRLVKETKFDLIVFTQDWHPTDHISFVDNVHLRTFHDSCNKKSDQVKIFDDVTFQINASEPRSQTLWPRHCVQESDGAEFHPDLFVPSDAIVVKKGTDPDVDSYSAFWDNSKLKCTPLEALLRDAGIDTVYVCGIATDVCVNFTAVDALDHGFHVYVIEDACRGVDEAAINKTLEEIRSKGGKVISSGDIL